MRVMSSAERRQHGERLHLFPWKTMQTRSDIVEACKRINGLGKLRLPTMSPNTQELLANQRQLHFSRWIFQGQKHLQIPFPSLVNTRTTPENEAQPRGRLPLGFIEKTTLFWGEGRLNSLSTSHAMPLTLWAGAGPGLLCAPAQTRPVRWRNYPESKRCEILIRTQCCTRRGRKTRRQKPTTRWWRLQRNTLQGRIAPDTSLLLFRSHRYRGLMDHWADTAVLRLWDSKTEANNHHLLLETITTPPANQFCHLTAFLDVAHTYTAHAGLVWENHIPWAKGDTLLNVQFFQCDHIGPQHLYLESCGAGSPCFLMP